MVRIPRQFGLRMMLGAVALIAITIVMTRDYVRLQIAREQYGRVYASWLAHRITLGMVVSESFPLMDAEESTLWISKRTAQQREVDRLKHLLQCVRSPTSESMPAEIERQTKYILTQIRTVDSAEADKIENDLVREEAEFGRGSQSEVPTLDQPPPLP